MYRGASFTTRYNASKRLQLSLQYTVAQAYDDDSNERDATCCRYDSSANFRAEYGYSNYDIRNQFAGWATYALPFGLHVMGDRDRFGRPAHRSSGRLQRERRWQEPEHQRRPRMSAAWAMSSRATTSATWDGRP